MKRPSATTVKMDSVEHRKLLSARQSSKESAKKISKDPKPPS